MRTSLHHVLVLSAHLKIVLFQSMRQNCKIEKEQFSNALTEELTHPWLWFVFVVFLYELHVSDLNIRNSSNSL